MDRGAWWATAHGVTRVRYDSETKLFLVFLTVTFTACICSCLFSIHYFHPYFEYNFALSLQDW